MESELIKKVQRAKKTFGMVLSMVLFCGLLYYIFLMPKSLKSEEEAAADANAVSQDIYQEYRDYISDTKKGIKSLLDGKQLQQMELKEYVPSETPLERNTGNIFTKPF